MNELDVSERLPHLHVLLDLGRNFSRTIATRVATRDGIMRVGGQRKALVANDAALAAWKDITPLGRNDFICWVEDAKRETTRERRIRRTQEELQDGQGRPCCWSGCKHRERNGKAQPS